MLCCSFIFCMTLPTFKYSVLKIFTFKSHLCCFYVNIFVLYSVSSLSCAIITWLSTNKRQWCVVLFPVGSPILLHLLFQPYSTLSKKILNKSGDNPHPHFILLVINPVDILFPVFTCASFLACIFWITTNISCGIPISLITGYNSFLGTKSYASVKSTKTKWVFLFVSFLWVGLLTLSWWDGLCASNDPESCASSSIAVGRASHAWVVKG